MGHSRILWCLKPKPKVSHRVQYPECPLCRKPMTPKQKTKTLTVNNKPVQVHVTCEVTNGIS